MRILDSCEVAHVAGAGRSFGFNRPIGFGTVTVTRAGGVTTVTATATSTFYGPNGGGTVTHTVAGGVSTCTSTFTGNLGLLAPPLS